MVVTAVRLIDDPNLLAEAKVEFEERTEVFTDQAAIPDDTDPLKPHV